MRRRLVVIAIGLAVTASLVGCRPSLAEIRQTETAAPTRTPRFTPGPRTPTPIPPTDVPIPPEQRGEILFRGQGACLSCHTIDGSENPNGPSAIGMLERIQAREPDADIRALLRAAIVDTNAFILEPYRGDLMPTNFGEIFTDEQLDDIITYILSIQ